MLSACETAVGGSVGSTAEQMAAVGLPAVLAMRFSVTDDGARLFTETLYTRLAFGDPLTKAMHDARLTLWDYVQKRRTDAPQVFTSAEWFTPVLYQNQAIGPLLKKGDYDRDTLGRFYLQTPFLAGKHTRLIGEGFIGRKRLLIRLRQCFGRGEHVCLHGLGGLGKTTTAEAFADSYRKRNGYDILIFRKGTEIQEAVILERIYERWKSETQPDEFRASQLKARIDDPNQSPTGKLQLLLDNCLKGRLTILIFDNFEDAQTDADGAQQRTIGSEGLRDFLRYLLKNAPSNCHILFTTRYQIADLTDLLTDLVIDKMTYAEQYRYVNFSETLRKLASPERVILDRRIDGHPRALGLLEGNLRKSRVFDLTEFDKEVGYVETKIFEDLLLNRLYVQLSESERDVFTTASVFFGRSPLAALSTVLDKPAEELMPILTALREWSLCFWDEQEQTFEVHALTQGWMRKQEYPNQEQYKTISRQVGVFFQEQLSWEDDFTAKAYFEQAETWDGYVTTAFRLGSFSQLTGLYTTAQDLSQDVLAKNISPEINTDALNRLGLIGLSVGDYEKALLYFEQSLETTQQTSDRNGEGTIFNNISQIYKSQGNYEKALEYLEKGLKIVQQIGDQIGEGAILNNIGEIYSARGNYKTALTYLQESLSIRNQTGDRSGEGATLNNIGKLYSGQRDYERALQYLERSLEIAKQIGERRGESSALNNIGQIYKGQGNYDKTLEYLEQSLKIDRQIGDRNGEGTTLSNLGQMYKSQANYEKALQYLKHSLEIGQQIGDQSGVAIRLTNIGAIYFDQYQDVRKAIPSLIQAYAIFNQIGSPNISVPNDYLSAIFNQIGREQFNQIVQSSQNTS